MDFRYFYPVASEDVLIDGCVAIGASDAGIYVGQSQNIIVKNSRAEFNVAGIEIENSYLTAFQNPQRIHASCEDYRAAASIDLEHDKKDRKKFYFFDDLNEKKLLNFKKEENLNKVLFLIISKSGNTSEVLTLFDHLVDELKSKLDLVKHFLVITEKNT